MSSIVKPPKIVQTHIWGAEPDTGQYPVVAGFGAGGAPQVVQRALGVPHTIIQLKANAPPESLIKPLLARLHREFNVAAAEVDRQDVWQSAVIAIVVVGNDAAHLRSELQNIVRWVEHNRPELEVADARFELR